MSISSTLISTSSCCLLLAVGCGPERNRSAGLDDRVDSSATDQQLATFYDQHGGRDALPDHQVSALEALLHAQDELDAGDRDAAQTRIDAIFTQMPLYNDIWDQQLFFDGSNIGHPVAYYGLRMLDQILEIGPTPATGTLHWTVVVAPCAEVTRPTLPNLEPETVQLDIAPEILANGGERLFLVTSLVRRWVQAITDGLEVQLSVHALPSCTTVDFSDDGSVILSYPDTTGMVSAVPKDIRDQTDFFWVIAPSGVPGDGSGYDRHFITGGMGTVGTKPMFISDDAWLVRKPEHLGSGAYTEAELRAYQPQWLQHELMHHLFRTWPSFGLEDADHQWFDRSTWPSDFEGRWEPDYYYEAIARRLLHAQPSLADGLLAPEPVDLAALGSYAIAGSYERVPVENDFHSVTVAAVGDHTLGWSNAAGVSWSLGVSHEGLWTRDDCPYGVQELEVEAEGDTVTGVWFDGERYQRTSPAPEPVEPTAGALVGRYERVPVENGWHGVWVDVEDDMLTWSNDAGVSWSLELWNGGLWTGDDSPYGYQDLQVEAFGSRVTGLWFRGERYGRR